MAARHGCNPRASPDDRRSSPLDARGDREGEGSVNVSRRLLLLAARTHVTWSDVVLARHVFSPRTLHAPNLIGGDIAGGGTRSSVPAPAGRPVGTRMQPRLPRCVSAGVRRHRGATGCAVTGPWSPRCGGVRLRLRRSSPALAWCRRFRQGPPARAAERHAATVRRHRRRAGIPRPQEAWGFDPLVREQPRREEPGEKIAALLAVRDLFRAQAVLSGRASTPAPKLRSHPDFPRRNFVRCEGCRRGLTGSWSKRRSDYYAYHHCRPRLPRRERDEGEVRNPLHRRAGATLTMARMTGPAQA